MKGRDLGNRALQVSQSLDFFRALTTGKGECNTDQKNLEWPNRKRWYQRNKFNLISLDMCVSLTFIIFAVGHGENTAFPEKSPGEKILHYEGK